MDSQEARAILGVYREGCGIADERFEQAFKQTQFDPELNRWWTEEQTLDRIISAKLQSTHIPAGLKERLAAAPRSDSGSAFKWQRTALLMAALFIALAVFFRAARPASPARSSLADYSDEMVSFVKLDPSLEVKSSELPRLTSFLQEAGAPSNVELPGPMRQMQPLGCRTLRFRGHNVALVCFKNEGGRLLHMFVLNRSAMPEMRPGDGPKYSSHGEWTTAAWVQGNEIYMVTMQGDQTQLRKYMVDA